MLQSKDVYDFLSHNVNFVFKVINKKREEIKDDHKRTPESEQRNEFGKCE